ncbi:Phenylalanine--tRNA ligase, mitochondrial [Rhodotorula toruloides]|nr:Phenylalanine--tRNA ligase, mitochondrial [Rhodotorula toruloides]
MREPLLRADASEVVETPPDSLSSPRHSLEMLAPRLAGAQAARQSLKCTCRAAYTTRAALVRPGPASLTSSPLPRFDAPSARPTPRSFARAYSARTTPTDPIVVEGNTYPRDAFSNVTPTILSKLPRRLHLSPSHPIGILRTLIESHFASFKHLNSLSPIVTVQQNFDDLGFPADHPGRALTDSYYLNQTHMLRTHTSAHEVESFRSGLEQFLLTADVYRRDEIDRSHYPVFHQMEGCSVFDPSTGAIERLEKENAEMRAALKAANIVIEDETGEETTTNPYQAEHDPRVARIIAEHLKNNLNGLVLKLFGGRASQGGEPLRVRWIEATFPWTAPSYEVEVMFNGKWLEILGCGVVRQTALERSGVGHKQGWAFGLGLERIAMVLFSIPDIRLFWSEDARFLSQFREGEISTFKPYSKYPECYKDITFWVPSQGEAEKAWHENDFMELVRDEGGDLVESVQLIDEFTHPKTGRKSRCYRLNYRSMDRSLSNEEVNRIQDRVIERVTGEMGVEHDSVHSSPRRSRPRQHDSLKALRTPGADKQSRTPAWTRSLPLHSPPPPLGSRINILPLSAPLHPDRARLGSHGQHDMATSASPAESAGTSEGPGFFTSNRPAGTAASRYPTSQSFLPPIQPAPAPTTSTGRGGATLLSDEEDETDSTPGATYVPPSAQSHSFAPPLQPIAPAPPRNGSVKPRAGSVASSVGTPGGSSKGKGKAKADGEKTAVGGKKASGKGGKRGQQVGPDGKPVPKKKKAGRACAACQKAHLTCDDARPCARCVKKGCPEDCVDGARKKAKYLQEIPDELLERGRQHPPGTGPPTATTPVPAAAPSLPQQTEPNFFQGSPTFSAAEAGPSQPMLAGVSQPTLTTEPQPQPFFDFSSAPPVPSTSAAAAYDPSSFFSFPSISAATPTATSISLANLFNDSTQFGSEAAGFEYAILNAMLNGNGFATDTNTQPALGGINGADEGFKQGREDPMLLDASAAGGGAAGPSLIDGEGIAPNGAGKPFGDGMDGAYGPAKVQQPGVLTAEEAYRSVTKPYPYAQSYHFLVKHLKERFEKNDILRIIRALATFRPSLIALQMPLTEEDETFVERTFQRTLVELNKLISFSGTPTVVWRRTGEICHVGTEFCLLTGWKREELVGKKYIFELFDTASVVEYYESFAKHAFESTATSITMQCVVLAPDGRPVPCAFCFSVRRDLFSCPFLVIGSFLPILRGFRLPSRLSLQEKLPVWSPSSRLLALCSRAGRLKVADDVLQACQLHAHPHSSSSRLHNRLFSSPTSAPSHLSAMLRPIRAFRAPVKLAVLVASLIAIYHFLPLILPESDSDRVLRKFDLDRERNKWRTAHGQDSAEGEKRKARTKDKAAAAALAQQYWAQKAQEGGAREWAPKEGERPPRRQGMERVRGAAQRPPPPPPPAQQQPPPPRGAPVQQQQQRRPVVPPNPVGAAQEGNYEEELKLAEARRARQREKLKEYDERVAVAEAKEREEAKGVRVANIDGARAARPFGQKAGLRVPAGVKMVDDDELDAAPRGAGVGRGAAVPPKKKGPGPLLQAGGAGRAAAAPADADAAAAPKAAAGDQWGGKGWDQRFRKAQQAAVEAEQAKEPIDAEKDDIQLPQAQPPPAKAARPAGLLNHHLVRRFASFDFTQAGRPSSTAPLVFDPNVEDSFQAGKKPAPKVATKDQERYNVTVCAMIPNENRFLHEFLLYHRLLGVEQFALYDTSHPGAFGAAEIDALADRMTEESGSGELSPTVEELKARVGTTNAGPDGLDEKGEIRAERIAGLERWIDQGAVKLHWMKFGDRKSARDFYDAMLEHCANRYGSTTDWLAVLDVDEFLSVTSPVLPEAPYSATGADGPKEDADATAADNALSTWQYPLHDLLSSPALADAACIPLPELNFRNQGVRELAKGKGVLETHTQRDVLKQGTAALREKRLLQKTLIHTAFSDAPAVGFAGPHACEVFATGAVTFNGVSTAIKDSQGTVLQEGGLYETRKLPVEPLSIAHYQQRDLVDCLAKISSVSDPNDIHAKGKGAVVCEEHYIPTQEELDSPALYSDKHNRFLLATPPEGSVVPDRRVADSWAARATREIQEVWRRTDGESAGRTKGRKTEGVGHVVPPDVVERARKKVEVIFFRSST